MLIIDTKDALKKVSERKPVKIGKFDLNLQYSEIRSKNFKSEVTTAKGREIAEPVKINTVQGTVINTPGSYVAMTIDDNLEGLITTSEGMFFVERADKYNKNLSKDNFVLYKQGDKKGGDSILCGVEEMLKSDLQSTKNRLAFDSLDMASSIMASSRLLEVATDADSKYVQLEGGEAQANQRILSVMNMVDITLFAELDINVTVVYQHAWNNPDPYAPNNPTNSGLTYTDFQRYWNTTAPFNTIPRDTAILFVGEEIDNGGLAIDDSVCKTPSDSYVVIRRDNFNEEGNGRPIEYNRVVHELAHNLGSEHTPSLAQGNTDVCFDRDPDIYKQSIPFLCAFRETNINLHLASFGSCLTRTTSQPSVYTKESFDYDGDRKADLAVFRPSDGYWDIRKSSGGSAFEQYGQQGDIPVAADYDGDRQTDLAVYREGSQSAFFLRRSALGRVAIYWGTTGDIPVQGDYNGDERTDVAVYRPSNGGWYIYNVFNGQTSSFAFGEPTDIPVQADYDGDGKTDLAVFRPSNGVWYIQGSQSGFNSVTFGQAGDKLVPADYTGDRKSDVAVYRDGVWYIFNIATGYIFSYPIGQTGDIPIIGDYDGDTTSDIAVRSGSSVIFTSTL